MGQVSQNLLILALFVVTNAMALVDDEQGKFTLKRFQITRHRLYAAENHFTVALFTLQASGKDIGFQPQRTIFGMILCDQLLHMRQH